MISRLRSSLLATGFILACCAGAFALGRMPVAETAASASAAAPDAEITDPGPDGRRIDEPGVFANVFPARGPRAGEGRAALVIGGSEGGLGDASTRTARMLQAEGWTVLQPAWFAAPGLPDDVDAIPLETFDRAIERLKAEPGVDADRIVVLGWSKGAEAALLVAARRRDVRATVAAAPAHVAWQGFVRSGNTRSIGSSWSSEGKPLPFIALGGWNGSVFDLYLDGLRAASPEALEAAAIPVERAAGPVLLGCGEDDGLWPACDMARAVEARVRARGGPAVVLLAYPGAGHAAIGPPFQADRPTGPSPPMMGGSFEADRAARADSWPRILAFLDQATR